MSELKTITPTLDRIFKSEQVQQKECYDLMSYRAEIRYSIRILTCHLERVRNWSQTPNDRKEDAFNTKFVELMRELEAMEVSEDVD